jgi:hypothetical protein
MNTESTISLKDTLEVIKLIREYLNKGGSGLSNEALERVLEALEWSDRIVIESEE